MTVEEMVRELVIVSSESPADTRRSKALAVAAAFIMTITTEDATARNVLAAALEAVEAH